MKTSSDTEFLDIEKGICVGNAHMISIDGLISTVLAYFEIHEWHPSQIVMLGYADHSVTLSEPNFVYLHVLMLEEKGAELASMRGALKEDALAPYRQAEYTYAHLLAGMDHGVRISVFGASFKKTKHARYISEVLFKTFFRKNGKCKMDQSNTNVLLLIGDQGERIISGFIYNRPGTFAFVTSPFGSNLSVRNAIVGTNALVCATSGNKYVCGTTAEDLVDHFTSEEFDNTFYWSHTRMGCDIDDIAVVDGSHNTIIFTFKEGEYRHMPAYIFFDRGGKMKLLMCPNEGVRASEIKGEMPAALVRVNTSESILFVDQDGSSFTICFDSAKQYGESFERMIERALSQNLSGNRPAIGV